MGSLIRFYAFVIRFALALAFMGQLKSCTLIMMNEAVQAQRGMISYSKYTKMLTGKTAQRPGSRK